MDEGRILACSLSRPLSALILDQRVASVFSGGNRWRPLWSELSELWDSQSILSLSLSPRLPPLVFLIARSPSPHSDGGHVWSRAENGQSGSSRTLYYHCSSYLSPLSLYTTAILSLFFYLYRAEERGMITLFFSLTSSVRDNDWISVNNSVNDPPVQRNWAYFLSD